MPQSCHLSTCGSISIALCLCCNEYLCRDHFIEHDYFLRSNLNDLTEQINQIDTQFKRFEIQKIGEDLLEKLDQWRVDSYRMIDQFYERKCEELNDYMEEIFGAQEEEILEVKFKLAKMVNSQQTTIKNLKLLNSDIQILQKQLTQLNNISIQLHLDPLGIDEDLIHIFISHPDSFELSTPYQILDRISLSSDAICSNNEYLLLHQNSHLYFLDGNSSIIEQKSWPHRWIRDMCWSSILNSFFLITSNDVYLVEQETFAIEHLITIQGRFWQSCTCSDTCLYLSKDTWNSSIEEFSLAPSIKLIKHYERSETMNQKQRIDSIEYRNQTLALVINDQTKQEIFLELRSIASFDRLWSCRFSIEYSERKLQCCSVTSNGWMVADWGSSSIFYLTNDGNIKKTIKYKHQIHYIHFFGENTLIISTNNSIHFHRL